MALNALTLAITQGLYGRPFAATILGLSAGSTVAVVPNIAIGEAYVSRGRLFLSKLTALAISPTLREVSPDGTIRDSIVTVTTDRTSRPDLDLGTLTVSIPTNITVAGSATVSGSSGGTLTLATNPDGAWSISGTTLSWTTAAIGKAGRPVIVEALSATINQQMETVL